MRRVVVKLGERFAINRASQRVSLLDHVTIMVSGEGVAFPWGANGLLRTPRHLVSALMELQ